MKAILATGELGTLRNVARASLVCMMAGADFIKTSTGKESVNATLPVALVMIRAIRDYHERTGFRVGYKPAGGISKAKDALTYLALMKDELGDRWLRPDLFRFGASSLLGDIERQLEHHVTGRYSAAHRHADGAASGEAATMTVALRARIYGKDDADDRGRDLRDHGLRPRPRKRGRGAGLARRPGRRLRAFHRRRLHRAGRDLRDAATRPPARCWPR